MARMRFLQREQVGTSREAQEADQLFCPEWKHWSGFWRRASSTQEMRPGVCAPHLILRKVQRPASGFRSSGTCPAGHAADVVQVLPGAARLPVRPLAGQPPGRCRISPAAGAGSDAGCPVFARMRQVQPVWSYRLGAGNPVNRACSEICPGVRSRWCSRFVLRKRQPFSKGEKWFFAVSGWLRRRVQRAHSRHCRTPVPLHSWNGNRDASALEPVTSRTGCICLRHSPGMEKPIRPVPGNRFTSWRSADRESAWSRSVQAESISNARRGRGR